VQAVVEDYPTAPIGEAEKRLFAFVEKVNGNAAAVTEADIAPLHAAGWTDEAIYDAVTVCALFNFFNRWVDGTGVPGMSEEAHRASGHRLALHGYVSR
jgi:alkylhydroperoxidase family enzyme